MARTSRTKRSTLKITTASTLRQVVLYPDHEDGGWVVEVPSLPGCISQGHTKEKALLNVRDAIEGWIDAAKSLGRRVPPENFDVQVCVV